MNLFARILSHGFALVVVALLALGLIYRGELFPEWELPEILALGQKPDAAATVQDTDTGSVEEPVPAPAAGAEDVVEEPAATQGALIPSEAVEEADLDTVAAVPSDVTVPGAVDTQTADPAAAADTATEADGQPAEVAVPAADETLADMQEPVETATGLAAEPGVTAEAAATGAAEAPAMEDVAAPPAAAETARGPTEAAATTPYRVLAAAREAYWLRDYAAAEQKYQELIALDPDNPDGYGELGNMYFSQGDWDKASASYYEAGTRLVTQGMYDRARQLVEVIRGLNGGQADDLEQQVNAAESPAP